MKRYLFVAQVVMVFACFTWAGQSVAEQSAAAERGAASAEIASAETERQAVNFVAGTHYKVLPIAVETADAEKVEVVEVFSYMCVHCYNFEPYLEAWHKLQTDAVAFRRIPASFNADWELLAQAYYTAQTLGVTDSVHTLIFAGIHNRRQDLRKAANLAQLFADAAQVSEEDFDAAYNSFSVRSQVQQAKALTRAYQVTGVPTLVVNGKYLVDGRMAGGNAAMLQVVDYLIAQELIAQEQ